jgi:hypothetical protein
MSDMGGCRLASAVRHHEHSRREVHVSRIQPRKAIHCPQPSRAQCQKCSLSNPGLDDKKRGRMAVARFAPIPKIPFSSMSATVVRQGPSKCRIQNWFLLMY